MCRCIADAYISDVEHQRMQLRRDMRGQRAGRPELAGKANPAAHPRTTLFYRRSVKFSMDQSIRRGDIYYADLSPVVGSEQGGIRPVLIVQNDMGNKYSPTVIAAAITSQINKARLPTHIELSAKTYGLTKDSVVLLEQIRTIDKRRLREKMGRLDEKLMSRIDEAIVVSFGLQNGFAGRTEENTRAKAKANA